MPLPKAFPKVLHKVRLMELQGTDPLIALPLTLRPPTNRTKPPLQQVPNPGLGSWTL